MKWIKLFEEVNNEYYQEISEEEYEDGHGVSFEQRYYDKLESFLNKPEVLGYKDMTNGADVFDGVYFQRGGIGSFSPYVTIYQDDDEWFYVRINGRAWWRADEESYDTYYKCDQFDGLIKLLKDKDL